MEAGGHCAPTPRHNLSLTHSSWLGKERPLSSEERRRPTQWEIETEAKTETNAKASIIFSGYPGDNLAKLEVTRGC